VSANSLAMMPWFPRDFIAATLGWRLLERGLYRCLLDAQWELGSLPADVTELALIAGATSEEFASAWPRVSQKFPATEAGRLSNEKLEEHRQKALRIKSARAEAGRTGGKVSASSRQAIASANVEAKIQANDIAIVKHPTPTPTPSIQECVVTRASGLSPEAEMAVELRKLDVNVTSIHPTLDAWVRDGFTVAQVSEAVAVARKTKPTGNIPPNYLDPILRQPQRPPAERPRAKGAYERLMEANSGD